MQYETIKAEVCVETVVNRSIFIATLVPIADESDAISRLSEIRKKYSDATHNCYAYIANNDGTGVRFSDDGEPSGTAAMPILEVLKKKKLVGTLAVVTRYFGGVKLGANGLVGAYIGAITAAIEKAETVAYAYFDFYEVLTSYNQSNSMQKLFSNGNITCLETTYDISVKYSIAVLSGEINFINDINDVTQGTAIISEKGKGYLPISSLKKQ